MLVHTVELRYNPRCKKQNKQSSFRNFPFDFFSSSSVSFQESFSRGFVLQGTYQNSLLFLCCTLLRLLANTCGSRHIIRGEMRTSEVERRVIILTLPRMQQRQGYIKVQQQWLRLTLLTTYAYSCTYPSPSFIYVRNE